MGVISYFFGPKIDTWLDKMLFSYHSGEIKGINLNFLNLMI
jgi:hypothetical protein